MGRYKSRTGMADRMTWDMGRRNSGTLLNVSTKFLFPTLKWKRLTGTYSILFWNDLVQLNGKKMDNEQRPKRRRIIIESDEENWTASTSACRHCFLNCRSRSVYFGHFFSKNINNVCVKCKTPSCCWSALNALISSRTSLIFNLTGFVCAIQ